MAKSSAKRYQWFAALYTLIGMLFYWWRIVKEVHLYLFGTQNEGIKNYFIPLYYILYDKSYHFSGFNYPHGEHIFQVETQSAISLLLSPLINENYEYAGNIITFLNLLMILSIPMGAIYLYKLFTLWKMPSFYSSVTAACIALLSPQVMFVTGHYSLSYVCYFPMLWYYTALWLKSQKISSIIGLIVVVTIFGFIHIHYLILSCIFLMATSCLYFIYKWRTPPSRKKLIILFFTTFIPLLIYTLVLKISGAHLQTFFSEKSFYNIDSVSGWREVFIPIDGKIKELIQVFFPIRDGRVNAYGYVGWGAMLSTFAGIWVLKDRVLEKEFLPSGMGVYLMAAILCLAISMGYPVKFFPASWMEHLGFIVSTLGNFNWAFYFVFSAVSAWLLYILSEFLRKKSHSVIATFILIVLVSFWAYEGLSLQKRQAHEILTKGKLANDYLSLENGFSKKLEEIGQRPEYFQAIIALPFSDYGKGKTASPLFYQVTKLAVNLHLPIAQKYNYNPSSADITTANWSSTLSGLSSQNDDRSFLLMTVGNDFNKEENHLIQGSRLLISQGEISLYDLPKGALNP